MITHLLQSTKLSSELPHQGLIINLTRANLQSVKFHLDQWLQDQFQNQQRVQECQLLRLAAERILEIEGRGLMNYII